MWHKWVGMALFLVKVIHTVNRVIIEVLLDIIYVFYLSPGTKLFDVLL